jgi:site-specific recombinase XerD
MTSIKSLSQGYILNCKCEGKSPATIRYYTGMLRRFQNYCSANGYPESPQQITANHIRQFLWYVANEPVRWDGSSTSARKPATMSTVAHYYRVLHAFFNWLETEQMIASSPMEKLKRPKEARKVVQALSPSEVNQLLRGCSSKGFLDVRNRVIIMVMLDSGMKVTELANLVLDDINLDTGSILIRKGKGNKQRIVRVGSKAQKALWQYVNLYHRGDTKSMFTDPSGVSLGVGGVKLMVRRLGKKCGLSEVHVHRLRHTFAISFLRAGGDVFSLQYLLGHSTLVMTQRYLQSLNADDAAKAHKRCSPLDNMKS